MNKFKNVFQYLRLSKNFNQEQMAEALGVSKSTIGMWETGKRLPSPDMFEQIADYFNVDIDYLYGRTSTMRKVLFDEYGKEFVNTNCLDSNTLGSEVAETVNYYVDAKTAKVAQEIKDNKELGLLFDAAKDASPEDLQTVHTMLLALKRKEEGITE